MPLSVRFLTAGRAASWDTPSPVQTASVSVVAGELIELDLLVFGGETEPEVTPSGLGITWELVVNGGSFAEYARRYRGVAPSDATGQISIAYGTGLESVAWVAKAWSGYDDSLPNGAAAYRDGQSEVLRRVLTTTMAAFGAAENRASAFAGAFGPPGLDLTGDSPLLEVGRVPDPADPEDNPHVAVAAYGDTTTPGFTQDGSNWLGPMFIVGELVEGEGGPGGGGGDPEPPVLTEVSPADNATGVAVDAALVLTFDQAVAAGTGFVELHETGVGLVEAWDVETDADFDGSTVTLELSEPLEHETAYHVLVDDGAIEALDDGEPWGGIDDPAEWNFTTAAEAPPARTLELRNLGGYEYSTDDYPAPQTGWLTVYEGELIELDIFTFGSDDVTPSGLGVTWVQVASGGSGGEFAQRWRGVVPASSESDPTITRGRIVFAYSGVTRIAFKARAITGYDDSSANGAAAYVQTSIVRGSLTTTLSALGDAAHRVSATAAAFGPETLDLAPASPLTETGRSRVRLGNRFPVVHGWGVTTSPTFDQTGSSWQGPLLIASELAVGEGGPVDPSGSLPEPDDLGAPLDTVAFFLSGHSLTDERIPGDVRDIAIGEGFDVDYQRQYVIGSSLEYRTAGGPPIPDSPSTITWPGYRHGHNRDGADLDLVEHFRNVQAVSGRETTRPYDALAFCEGHDLLQAIASHNTVPLSRGYYELVREGSPGCVGYFYTTWLPYTVAGLSTWIAYARAKDLAHAAVCSRVNASLALEGRSDRLQILPVSGALAELVEQATTGTLAGITGATVDDTLALIFSDHGTNNVHLTDLGKYFAALVIYGTLYRRDPRGAIYPSTVTGEQAESLQQVAWETLLATFGDAPHLGPQFTATDAQQELVDFVDLYADVYDASPGHGQGDPARAMNRAAMASLLGGTSTAMYFSGDLEEDAEVWYPPPATSWVAVDELEAIEFGTASLVVSPLSLSAPLWGTPAVAVASADVAGREHGAAALQLAALSASGLLLGSGALGASVQAAATRLLGPASAGVSATAQVALELGLALIDSGALTVDALLALGLGTDGLTVATGQSAAVRGGPAVVPAAAAVLEPRALRHPVLSVAPGTLSALHHGPASAPLLATTAAARPFGPSTLVLTPAELVALSLGEAELIRLGFEFAALVGLQLGTDALSLRAATLVARELGAAVIAAAAGAFTPPPPTRFVAIEPELRTFSASSTMQKTIVKDPDATLDYGFNWSSWLQTDEEIAESSWTADDDELEIGSGAFAPQTDGSRTTVWLSGGVAGQKYRVTNRVTTDNTPPRTDERSFFVSVRDR
jgi:hypothetical protein